MRFLVSVCVCFVAPIVSSAHVAKYSNFRNSTHTHDPALSHFPLHRYFRKSGTVPEFRINKPRLGNKLPVATLCVSYQVCRFTVKFHDCVMAKVIQRRPTSFTTISMKMHYNFFLFMAIETNFLAAFWVCKWSLKARRPQFVCDDACVCAPDISSKFNTPCINFFSFKVPELFNNTP